jgi:capsular polysaccharide biosynthesis protein
MEADQQAGVMRTRQLPQRTLNDRTIVAGGWGVDVYGHFLIEMLPRLWVAKQALGDTISDYKILVSSIAKPWLINILTGVLGFSENQLVFYDPEKEFILIREAVLPTLTSFDSHFHPVSNRIIDDLVKDTREHNVFMCSRLFLSRAMVSNPATAPRKCLNEARLAEIAAREFGFTVIAPETLSWPIQINMFHNAEVIAGEFGSGLHNALFAKAGTRVGSIGIHNLAQSLIGALRQHRNAYLAITVRANGEFEIEEETFRSYLASLVAE